MKRHFEMLAAYNTWVNERLYDAAASLPETEYRRDRGAFFGSLHGTLNHLLLGDIIWMHRFTGEGEEPAKLDDILFDDFGELRRARRQEDARIEAYVKDVDAAQLEGTVTYRTTRNPTTIEQELAPLLIHFFNHQTHHRGQAHGLLTAACGEAPSFDLLVYQRQTGVSIRKGSGGNFAPTEKRPG